MIGKIGGGGGSIGNGGGNSGKHLFVGDDVERNGYGIGGNEGGGGGAPDDIGP